MTWPQSALESGEHWPEAASLNDSTILQLESLRKNGWNPLCTKCVCFCIRISTCKWNVKLWYTRVGNQASLTRIPGEGRWLIIALASGFSRRGLSTALWQWRSWRKSSVASPLTPSRVPTLVRGLLPTGQFPLKQVPTGGVNAEIHMPAYRDHPRNMENLFPPIADTYNLTWADIQHLLNNLLTAKE